MPAARFKTEQRRHFVVSVVLPAALVAIGPVALPAGWLSWQAAGIFLAMWWLTGCLGVSVGFHRLFAHRSFTAPDGVRLLLGGLGGMAMQGNVIYWTALHRCHHAFSDQPGDPHSPSATAHPGRGFWASFWLGHMGWVMHHDVPKASRYAADLVGDPVAVMLTKSYWTWVLAGFALPALIGATLIGGFEGMLVGAWWGGALRVTIGQHVIWSINSVCHAFGARPHKLDDRSANNGWLSLISWGESWHNNHHSSPVSARLGFGWRQPDVGWLCIRLMHVLRLVHSVRCAAPDSGAPSHS